MTESDGALWPRAEGLVARVLGEHEYELSDGFHFYYGQDGVRRCAREIVALFAGRSVRDVERQEVEAAMDALLERGRARREAATDPAVRGLCVTDFEWLEADEREAFDKLDKERQRLLPSMAEYAALVAAKREASRNGESSTCSGVDNTLVTRYDPVHDRNAKSRNIPKGEASIWTAPRP